MRAMSSLLCPSQSINLHGRRDDMKCQLMSSCQMIKLSTMASLSSSQMIKLCTMASLKGNISQASFPSDGRCRGHDKGSWQRNVFLHEPMLDQYYEHGELISRESFMVRSFEIDFNQRATVEALINYSQEALLNHLRNSGLLVCDGGYGSTSEMKKRNLTWVTIRMNMALDSYPLWNEVIYLDTWLTLFGKIGFRYNGQFIDSKTGKVLMRASSVFVLLNLQTRKLAKFVDEIRAEVKPRCLVGDPILLDTDLHKLPNVEDHNCAHIRKGITPQWSDLDVNQHVNNVKTISWVLEGTPISMRNSYELCGMAINYRKECGGDDKLESLSRFSPDVVNTDGRSKRLQLDHLLRLEDGTEIARAKTTWRPKNVYLV
ncbi:hypothetical protein Droror1_Dr00013533 [Drosera rotundifolia]